MNKTDHVIISWTCVGTCIMFHDTFVGGQGEGKGAGGMGHGAHSRLFCPANHNWAATGLIPLLAIEPIIITLLLLPYSYTLDRSLFYFQAFSLLLRTSCSASLKTGAPKLCW